MNRPEKENMEDAVRKAFNSGSVFSDDDERIGKYLRFLASAPVPNELIRHTFIIRALIINSIKQDRALEKSESRAHKYAVRVLWLSFLAIALSVYSIYQSHQTSSMMQRLVEAQEAEVKMLDIK